MLFAEPFGEGKIAIHPLTAMLMGWVATSQIPRKEGTPYVQIHRF